MKRKHSVWEKVFFPLTLAMVAQIFLIIGVIYANGTIKELDGNELRILTQKVINRSDYLRESMDKWSNLEKTISTVNKIAEEYYQDFSEEFEKLEENDTLYEQILNEMTPELINLQRNNSVNGVFLILSTTEPSKKIGNKPGIYLRDLDAISQTPPDNSDILAKRIPDSISKKLNIELDSGCKPLFYFGEGEECYDFFLKPYEQAFMQKDISSMECGYWSNAFSLEGDHQKVITYSVPLKLDNGMVYGVIGIDVTQEALRKILGYQELSSNKTGAYILGIQREKDLVDPQIINGPVFFRGLKVEEPIQFGNISKNVDLEDKYYVWVDSAGQDYYTSIQQLNIYSYNSPFKAERWVLCGSVGGKELFAFSEQFDGLLKATSISCIIVGIFVVVIVTLIISKPLMEMVEYIRNSNPNAPVTLPKTKIRELDELGDAIEQLSTDVFDISTKFYQIIKMASVEMAGVEIDEITGKLYITDGFFKMFGINDIDYDSLTSDVFAKYMRELHRYVSKESENELLYEIEREGSISWIQLNIIRQNGKWFALAENVTKQIHEIQKVEHERDYDMLTNLLNRRAFRSRTEALLNKKGQSLRISAVIMLDLDNLKLLNDTYGHDWGDRYIQLTAQSIKKYLPKESIVARMSGDEFLIFLYGYESKEEIRQIIADFERWIGEEDLTLPDGSAYRLRLSGGIAWYPQDSKDYNELIKYADFAMYKVKKSIKGSIWEFDKESYLKEYYLLQNKEELNKLIEQQLVVYHFQPIISVKDGEVLAYEALMRSKLDTIPSIAEIFALAKQEYKLGHIERLTWFQAMHHFVRLKKENIIPKKSKVFINSIPNQILTVSDCAVFEGLYQEELSNIVLEVTEEEKMNVDIQEEKQNMIRRWNGQIAIDDYGTGYNGQVVLLRTSPEYVKIDMGFVRDVHLDENKQNLVRSTVEYAQLNNIKVIAEGTETIEEIRKLIELGVDYLQGYYYAKPEAQPKPIDIKKKNELIKLYHLINDKDVV